MVQDIISSLNTGFSSNHIQVRLCSLNDIHYISLMETPLVNKKYLLEKYPGKGGWTYALIPEILQDKNAHFGWVKVKGSIDGYEIRKYNLMPMGKGRLFLPVKVEIRKKIKKEAGDFVHIILYPDHDALIVPEQILLCLQDEPDAFDFFNSLNENEKQKYTGWIISAKNENTQVERITKTIERLLQKKKF